MSQNSVTTLNSGASVKYQSALFSTVALGASVASIYFAPDESINNLMILSIFIFVLGVPHGAIDPLFAQKLLQITNWRSWFKFILIYLLWALGMVVLWVTSPVLFMFTFLVLSILHFSRDLNSTTPFVTKALYGGAVIVLPTIFHLQRMTDLFSMILDPQSGYLVGSVIARVSIPWAALLVIAICFECQRNRAQAIEISALTLMAILAQPLIAFTVFFCLMHSLRHIIRSKDFVGVKWSKMGATAAWPMALSAVAVLLCWTLLPNRGDYSKVLQLVFVGLAALTVPHMILVDRVKYPVSI